MGERFKGGQIGRVERGSRAGKVGRGASRVILVILAVAILALALPAMAADTPKQPSRPDAHFIRVLRGGSEVEFYGEIRAGAAQELRAVLEANPQAKVIHLNSPGGSVLEARRMSVLIRAKNLIATVDAYCNSACVFAYLGAEQRYISSDGELGLHHESSDNATPSEIAASELIDQDFMADLGIKADFIKKAFSAPASGLWVPSTRELIDSGMVTGVRGDFAMGGYSGRTVEDQVDNLIDSSYVMKALKSADTARYLNMRASYIEALRQNVSHDEFAALVDRAENAVFGDYLTKASDALLRDYATTSVALMRRSVAANPAGCRLTPDGAGGFNLHIDPGSGVDFRPQNEAAGRAVADGALRRTPPPSPEAVGAAMAALHLAFRARHPDEVPVMNDLSSARLKPGQGCTALGDYLETSFGLPPTEAIAFLRYNYSTESVSTPGQPSVTDQKPRPHGNKQSD
jgi:hypothetical protein